MKIMKIKIKNKGLKTVSPFIATIILVIITIAVDILIHIYISITIKSVLIYLKVLFTI